MSDKEKIINGLKWHIRTTKANECRFALVDCPYVEECKTVGTVKLFEDILALLKEQEAKTVIKIAKRFNDCDLTGFCPFCSRPLIKDWAEKYCGYCGNPVLWEGR